MSTYLAQRTFWVATVERAVKTVAQSAAALLVGDAGGLLAVDWVAVASVSGLAGVASILSSVASGKVGTDSPSLVD